MKTLLLIFISFLMSCYSPSSQKSFSRDQKEIGAEDTSEEVEKDFVRCHLNEEENLCLLSEFGYKKSLQLSHTGIFYSKLLQLPEIRKKYQLTEEQIRCFKNYFCKEKLW